MAEVTWWQPVSARPAARSAVNPAESLPVLDARALAGRQITIHLGQIFEHGHAWQGFDDLENLLDLRLQMNERGLAAAFFECLARCGEHAQPRAANEPQLRQVED